MIVAGKYEVSDLISDQGVRSFRARHVTLRHDLMIHFIPEPDGGSDLSLLERLAELPEASHNMFIDAVEHESEAYLVSYPLPGFDKLPARLDRMSGKAQPKPNAASAVQTKTTRTTSAGEFS